VAIPGEENLEKISRERVVFEFCKKFGGLAKRLGDEIEHKGRGSREKVWGLEERLGGLKNRL